MFIFISDVITHSVNFAPPFQDPKSPQYTSGHIKNNNYCSEYDTVRQNKVVLGFRMI